MATLLDFAKVLAGASVDSEPFDPEDWDEFALEFAFDALQHQGTPKRAAYVHMPALVELEMDSDLWTLWGTLGAGAHRRGGPDAQSGEVRDRFLAALASAAGRILERLRYAQDEGDAMSLLTALAGVLRQPRLHGLLEDFDHGIDHTCVRCAATLSLARRGSQLEVSRAGSGRILQRGQPVAPLSPPQHVLVEAAASAGWQDLQAAMTSLFGSFECPRCSHRQRLLDDDTERPPGATIFRRVADPSSSEVTLEMPPSLRERIVSALLESARTRSGDRIRLAGVGLFVAKQFSPYTGPSTSSHSPSGPSTRQTKLMLPFFCAEQEAHDLLNGLDVTSPPPSDDLELDAFAARILTALITTNTVNVPRMGSFVVRRKEARRGATVDGDPAIVRGRTFLAFVAALDFKRALNPPPEKGAEALADAP